MKKSIWHILSLVLMAAMMLAACTKMLKNLGVEDEMIMYDDFG